MQEVAHELTVLKRFSAEHGEALEEVACPLCGSPRSDEVLEARDVLFGKPGTYRLVRCDDCGLRYVNPRPSFEALAAHYPDDYHCYRSDDDAAPWLRPLARLATHSQAVTRLKRIERVLGRLKPGMELCDVGCGHNALLHHIQKARGVTGLGIDMKPEMVAHVRDRLKMPVIEGTLLDAGLSAQRFDVVAMLEYLEHEADPLRVLHEARRVLAPGGHVVIEIPDIEGLPAKLFKHRWVNLDLPRHLVFFDRATLARALEQSGFELVSHERFGIPLYVGLSLMLRLGAQHVMRYWGPFVFGAQLMGMPFLPMTPWLYEFSFVVARAV